MQALTILRKFFSVDMVIYAAIVIVAATASSDLRGFELWSPLPSGYTSCRPASQEELGLFTRGLNLRFSCD